MAGELSKAVMVEFAERFTALEAGGNMGETFTPPLSNRGKQFTPTVVQKSGNIAGSVPDVE